MDLCSLCSDGWYHSFAGAGKTASLMRRSELAFSHFLPLITPALQLPDTSILSLLRCHKARTHTHTRSIKHRTNAHSSSAAKPVSLLSTLAAAL